MNGHAIGVSSATIPQSRAAAAAARPSSVGQEWAKQHAEVTGNHRYHPGLFPQVRFDYGSPDQDDPTTLSRWRHGFEPCWDYQGKRSARRVISGTISRVTPR